MGAATPQTTFSVFGTGGLSIFNAQIVGPQFTLTQRSVLVEVGVFVNNCGASQLFFPECADALPLVVQIRRSVNGVPDPTLLVAAAPLSHDKDPFTVSFESTSLEDVTLEPGTYFALFAPQKASDVGLLLGTANAGGYVAGLTTLGVVTPTGSSLDTNLAAVRIVAKVVHKPQ